MDGILNVYKEKGYTSHDVVAKLRGILKQKKIGHTGTLDPDAEGVLPVCLGKSTKVCGILTDKDKTYETTLLLGRSTDTQDISGNVVEEKNASYLTEAEVHDCIMNFVGGYEQLPPMYSALKVGGKKLYELARQGIEVERKKRPVTIYAIEVLEYELPRVRMRVKCSKGTYIRTLCHDIGLQLGCGACMETLLRTEVSVFQLSGSLRLSDIEMKMQEGTLAEYVVPTIAMFPDYSELVIAEKYGTIVYNGNSFEGRHIEPGLSFCHADGEQVKVFDARHRFVGIYCYDEKGRLYRPVKMFLEGIE